MSEDRERITHYVIPQEIRNIVAGGVAGMIAKSVVAPIDRIKILYQITTAQFKLRDIPRVIQGIAKTEGFVALWKGNTATLIRVFPYSGIQFMVFDRLKHYFLEKKAIQNGQDSNMTALGTDQHSRSALKWGLTPVESLIAGSCAGVVSVLCTYPLDLTRAQLAVLKYKRDDKGVKSSSQGFLSVFMDNYKLRGLVGLFRGITPTLLGILPYSGIAFTINEQGKRMVYHISGRDPTHIERLLCGGLSGLVAQTVTYPLEVTRRRMQTIGIVPTSGSAAAVDVLNVVTSSVKTAVLTGEVSVSSDVNSQHSKPPSMIRTIRQVFTEQGVRGFFKGVTMNYLKGPVAFGISFTTYDVLQGLLQPQEGI